MALQAITDSLDSVEEQYRTLYEEKDGKLILSIAFAARSALSAKNSPPPKAGWKVCRRTSTLMLPSLTSRIDAGLNVFLQSSS